MVKHIEERVTEQLRKNQGTHNDTKLSKGQFLESGWIRYRTPLKALCSGIKDGQCAPCHKLLPGLEPHETGKLSADTTGQVSFHQFHLAALGWKGQDLTATLHGGKIEVCQHNFVRGATESGEWYF